MKKATLFLNNITLHISQTHKLRGFIGNLFENYDVIDFQFSYYINTNPIKEGYFVSFFYEKGYTNEQI